VVVLSKKVSQVVARVVPRCLPRLLDTSLVLVGSPMVILVRALEHKTMMKALKMRLYEAIVFVVLVAKSMGFV
jgi:hypothetical protein